MNNKLLTVGTLAFDTIETPFVRVERTMGGAANYSALASAIFDIEQAVVSVVGEDYPASFLQILSETISLNYHHTFWMLLLFS